MEILEKDDIRVRINRKNTTAYVINSPKLKGRVTIPDFIEYDNIKFTIISIENHAFVGNSITDIDFSEHSEVKVFKNESFYKISSLKSLFLPASLEKIEPGCFFKVSKPFSIKISEKNKHFSLIKDTFLVEKSDTGDETLIYTKSDIEKVVIPSTIKHIRPSSLSNNTNLKSLEFDVNSKIESIKYGVITETVEKLVIPKSLNDIEQSCFQLAINLNDITVLKGNQTYKVVNDLLLKKSKTGNFDEIVFCKRNVLELNIPNEIKKIASYSISNCIKMTKFGIKTKSSLETIESYAFLSNGIKKIGFGPSLKNIESFAFYGMKNLTNVVFLSEDIRINFNCFHLCNNLKSINFKCAKKLFFEGSVPPNTKVFALPEVELNCEAMDQFKRCIIYANNNNNSSENYTNAFYDNQIKKLEEENKKLKEEIIKLNQQQNSQQENKQQNPPQSNPQQNNQQKNLPHNDQQQNLLHNNQQNDQQQSQQKNNKQKNLPQNDQQQDPQQKNPPQSSINPKSPQSNIKSNPPQSSIKSNSSQSSIKSNPPQNNIKSNSSQSNIKSNPPQSSIKSNPQQSSIKSNSSQSNIKSNPQQSSIKSNSSQSNIKSNSSQSSIKSNPPQSNIKSNSSQSNIKSNSSQSSIKSNSSQSSIKSNPPQSSIKSNPPQSNIKSNPQQSSIKSNPPQSNIKSNPPQSNIKSNPPQSNIKSNSSQSSIKSKSSQSSLKSNPPQSNVKSNSSPKPPQSHPNSNPPKRPK